MTDEKLGALFGAFAHFYWSVPQKLVVDKIADWHPEVTAQQVERVLRKSDKSIFWHHFCVVQDGVEEPEIAVEHLIVCGEDDLDRFLALRMDIPFHEYDEETILKYEKRSPDIPEVNAILDFGRTELGLDDEWASQLVDDCVLSQPYSLCEGESWVMGVLRQEQYGKIRFRTIEQIKRFRELGNALYQVLPNPVCRGWKPMELEAPPALLDEIPEKDEEIPDGRPQMDAIFDQYGGREKVSQLLKQHLSEPAPKRKIGRNEPCPCGSGKKYKKCCGR